MRGLMQDSSHMVHYATEGDKGVLYYNPNYTDHKWVFWFFFSS